MYLSRTHCEEYFDVSRSTVNRMIRYIREGIAQGKYPKDAVLYISGRPRVNEETFRTALIDREWERVAR